MHVLELPMIAVLVEAGALVVCGGGGGVPVCSEGDGFGGVDALVDSDLTSSLLAVELDADRLMLLTDVGEVRAGFGTTEERPLRRITLRELATMTLDVRHRRIVAWRMAHQRLHDSCTEGIATWFWWRE